MRPRSIADSRRTAPIRSRWAGLFFWLGSSVLFACTFDPDDRCGAGQVVYGANERWVCAPTFAPTETGCVPCAEDEVPGVSGCVCKSGFFRPSEEAACEPAPQGLGVECDGAANPCTSETYSHCELGSGTSGYCTSVGC